MLLELCLIQQVAQIHDDTSKTGNQISYNLQNCNLQDEQMDEEKVHFPHDKCD